MNNSDMNNSDMNNSDMNKNCDPEFWHNNSFEHRFFASLMRMNRLMRQHVEQEMASVDLSPPQMWFLGRLAEAGSPQPISFFADKIHSNRSNATQMIDRLEAEGLVQRVKNPNDRRSVLVELTKAGIQRLMEGHECHNRIIGELLEPLSEEERNDTLKVFQRITDLLDNE